MANIEDLRDRSVSSGTLKSEDLIPKFLGVLKTYGKDKYDKYIKENPEVEDWENLDDETMGWVVDELTDLLNEIAPDGCYFGASEGDGADFGFWSMSNESKKSEDASVHELEFVDIDEVYSASDFDDLVYKVVFSGQLDVDTDKVEQGVLPNDIILTARGYNTATFDFEVDKIVKQLAGTGIVLTVDDVIKNEDTYAKKSDESKKSEADGDYVKEAELAFQVTSDKIADYFYDGAYELDTEIRTMVYYDRKDIQYESTDNGVVAEVPMTFEAIFSDIRKYARELASLASAAIDDAVGEADNELTEYGQDLDSDYSFDDAETNGETWTWKVRFIWKHTTADESKKSEANGNKDIFTLDLTRIYTDGDEVGLDDMQAAQNFYDEDEAIQAAKDLADSYKDDDDVVQVTVMAGEQEKPNGDIVGDSFDIFTASSSDSATTAKYREKAGYTKTDGLDYYAKGGKSEGNDDDKGCKGKDCKDDNIKKSESLTLKQKELKDMARFGQAEDITTISDAEAKELKKKGIETVGISRGTYGMNGALLRDSEGNKYVITARSSNLFYFV